MGSEKAFMAIIAELKRAEEKFPGWPDDVVHASAILNEEAGELTQAALDYFYGRYTSTDRMKKEAAQVGAMALRFLIGLDIAKASTPPSDGESQKKEMA